MDIMVQNLPLRVMNEIHARHWSHEIGMQSLRMRRNLNLNPDTLPGKVYDKLLDSTTQKRKVHKTVLHKSGRSLKSINKEMQLHFQYCSPNEKKKLNKQIWNMLHKAQMSSNEFQLNKYKHKVLTRVNDTTHVLYICK